MRIELIIVILIFCSCSKKETTNNNFHKVPETSKEVFCRFRITNDSMIYNLFPFNTFTEDSSLIRSVIGINSTLDVKSNVGYGDNIYELLSYKKGSSNLTFQKNDGGFYLIEGHIKDINLKIYDDCYVGIDKLEFIKKFNIKNFLCDTLEIRNNDQTYEFLFIFGKNERLSEVIITSED